MLPPIDPSALKFAMRDQTVSFPLTLADGQYLIDLVRKDTSLPHSLTPEELPLLQGLCDLTMAHLRSHEGRTISRRGKPSRAIPAIKWKVSVRQDLALFVDMFLLDPSRDKLKYGERSSLIEQLLLEWARNTGFKG